MFLRGRGNGSQLKCPDKPRFASAEIHDAQKGFVSADKKKAMSGLCECFMLDK